MPTAEQCDGAEQGFRVRCGGYLSVCGWGW